LAGGPAGFRCGHGVVHQLLIDITPHGIFLAVMTETQGPNPILWQMICCVLDHGGHRRREIVSRNRLNSDPAIPQPILI